MFVCRLRRRAHQTQLHSVLCPARVLPDLLTFCDCRPVCHPFLHPCSTGAWTNFDTAVDVAIRDANYKPDANAKAWPGDKQGYTQISHADTAENYAKHQKQWVKSEATFTAPSDMVGGPLAHCTFCATGMCLQAAMKQTAWGSGLISSRVCMRSRSMHALKEYACAHGVCAVAAVLLPQVTLAFINAKRPKECGSCGSLLDAVCLQKV